MTDPVEARPTVYITESRSVDYSPATAYGDIKLLELGHPMPFTKGLPSDLNHNKAMAHRIRKALSDYIPGHDLIVPTGAPTTMLAVGAVLGTIRGRHRILGWDGHARRYLEYVVEV